MGEILSQVVGESGPFHCLYFGSYVQSAEGTFIIKLSWEHTHNKDVMWPTQQEQHTDQPVSEMTHKAILSDEGRGLGRMVLVYDNWKVSGYEW